MSRKRNAVFYGFTGEGFADDDREGVGVCRQRGGSPILFRSLVCVFGPGVVWCPAQPLDSVEPIGIVKSVAFAGHEDVLGFDIPVGTKSMNPGQTASDVGEHFQARQRVEAFSGVRFELKVRAKVWRGDIRLNEDCFVFDLEDVAERDELVASIGE